MWKAILPFFPLPPLPLINSSQNPVWSTTRIFLLFIPPSLLQLSSCSQSLFVLRSSLKMLKCEVVCHPVNNIFYQREKMGKESVKSKKVTIQYGVIKGISTKSYGSQRTVWQLHIALWGRRSEKHRLMAGPSPGVSGELERSPASVNAQPCQREWSSQTVGSCPHFQALLSKLWEAAKALSVSGARAVWQPFQEAQSLNRILWLIWCRFWRWETRLWLTLAPESRHGLWILTLALTSISQSWICLQSCQNHLGPTSDPQNQNRYVRAPGTCV